MTARCLIEKKKSGRESQGARRQVENTTFRKLDLFPSSGEEGKTPTQLGPLERANLSQVSSVQEAVKKRDSWKRVGREPPIREDLSAEAEESPLYLIFI
jgi:hypothetical protein